MWVWKIQADVDFSTYSATPHAQPPTYQLCDPEKVSIFLSQP